MASRKQDRVLPLAPDVPYVEYDETEAVCPQCGSVFRSPEVLEAHVRESHGTPGSEVAKGTPKKVRCSVCRAGFSSIAALQRHNREAHVG
jgi:C2H2 type zinc finger protein/C2H2-type zinc finger protein